MNNRNDMCLGSPVALADANDPATELSLADLFPRADFEKLHPLVLASMNAFLICRNPDQLTLEQVMMCFYLKPCLRVDPPDNLSQRYQYGRGSLLVYEGLVHLVLLPEDDTLTFPFSRVRIVGAPSKRFKGLLPRSRFLNAEGVLTLMEKPESVVPHRNALRQARAEHAKLPPEHQTGMGLFDANERGQLNDHRCSEAFGLGARLTAVNLRRRVARDG